MFKKDIAMFNFLNREEQDSSSFYPLLEIGDIRMFMLADVQDIYLAYVLQDRVLRKKDKKLQIKELLIGHSDYSTILDLIDKKIDICHALIGNEEIKDINNIYRIGQIGNTVFDKKEIISKEEIQDKIPQIGVKLNEDILNSIDTMLVRERIENRKKSFEDLKFEEKRYIKEYTVTITSKKEDNVKFTKIENFYNLNEKHKGVWSNVQET